MKKSLLLIVLSFCFLNIFASHIVGGEVAYTYLGPGTDPNTSRYTVLLRLFTECDQACGGSSGVACPPSNPIIGIFTNLSPFSKVTDLTLSSAGNPQISLGTYPPCLDNHPVVCYQVNTYTGIVQLADNAVGYRLAYQSCCRAASINVSSNASTVSGVPGATYEATMPGTNLIGAAHNSTAIVKLKDTALICHNSAFTLEFSAADPDPQDSLSYQFAAAYNGGSFTATNDGTGPDTPPYGTVTYQTGYSGTSPLGNSVTINPLTGVISGIAPAAIGKYVVNVIVREWRSGVLIAEHRKDFLVRTNECTVTKAQLGIIPVTCDGYTVDFSQFNTSSGNITDYQWIFGDPASGSADTSTLAGPIHVYTDTGVYKVRLKVTSGNVCIDSTSQLIKVYPGFHPDFSVKGQCKNTPIQFNDLTVADYGFVNSWNWNFGDVTSTTNTSVIQNPVHTYATANNYDVRFIVTSSKGCIDTVTKNILITDKPALSVTNDTLICVVDTLQLNAVGDGSFLWSPNYNINNVNISNPLVSPDVTTTYRVTLTDPFGCVGTDSVKVSVVDHVTMFANPDTTICRTDAIVLNLQSNALHYLWTETPAGNTLSNPAIRNPVATPLALTSYHVVGNIGKCSATSDITVKVVPYPKADAGADQTICFGKSAQLQATGGSSYLWSPAAFLNNRLIANPISQNPTANIRYIVTVTDTLGCPKPVSDTVVVFVAKIKADAGPRDTMVVLDQPLLLQATGSTHYLWSPAQWLSNIGISNPVALPRDDIEYIVKVSNDAGCFDYDSIRVHLFKLDAGMYVPSAFTPNGDGLNDYFHPIIIGMKSLDLFRVYNRWGQLLYSGTDFVKGWDGTFGGKGQESATYVWYAEGTDYKNNKLKKKGYVVLIR
ncbi:PKD domain-containing protein [Ferruginibacter sp.]